MQLQKIRGEKNNLAANESTLTYATMAVVLLDRYHDSSSFIKGMS